MFAAALLAAQPVCACGLPGGSTIESERFILAYRTNPVRIAVGEQFSVDIEICPRTGVLPVREHALRAAAHMPEHRHGMNYKPGVAPLGNGRYRSEGWLFHMPGRWEFVFEFDGERLADSVRLE